MENQLISHTPVSALREIISEFRRNPSSIAGATVLLVAHDGGDRCRTLEICGESSSRTRLFFRPVTVGQLEQGLMTSRKSASPLRSVFLVVGRDYADNTVVDFLNFQAGRRGFSFHILRSDLFGHEEVFQSFGAPAHEIADMPLLDQTQGIA